MLFLSQVINLGMDSSLQKVGEFKIEDLEEIE